jgi:glycogen synthase
MNGINTVVWSPQHDSFLPLALRYGVDDVHVKKAAAKAHLQVGTARRERGKEYCGGECGNLTHFRLWCPGLACLAQLVQHGCSVALFRQHGVELRAFFRALRHTLSSQALAVNANDDRFLAMHFSSTHLHHVLRRAG